MHPEFFAWFETELRILLLLFWVGVSEPPQEALWLSSGLQVTLVSGTWVAAGLQPIVERCLLIVVCLPDPDRRGDLFGPFGVSYGVCGE